MSEDQAQGLREYVKQTMSPNAPKQPIAETATGFLSYDEPDWHIRIGITDGKVSEVDWVNSIFSGTLSTPPTVDHVKQWLADAVKFLEGK